MDKVCLVPHGQHMTGSHTLLVGDRIGKKKTKQIVLCKDLRDGSSTVKLIVAGDAKVRISLLRTAKSLYCQ